ncbi:MAG: hypothetical protein ACYC6A_10315 [Armatimonadota bacterium]
MYRSQDIPKSLGIVLLFRLWLGSPQGWRHIQVYWIVTFIYDLIAVVIHNDFMRSAWLYWIPWMFMDLGTKVVGYAILFYLSIPLVALPILLALVANQKVKDFCGIAHRE